MPPRYPRVPISAFGEARIPKPVRRRIRKRSVRAARREFQPGIRALRDERDSLSGQLNAALAADAQAIADTGQAIADTPLNGLTGKYRQQTKAGLAQLSVANEGALPGLQADTRAGFQSRLTAADQAIIAERIQRDRSAQSAFQSGLTEARQDAEEYLKAQQKDREDAKQDPKQVASALYVAAKLYRDLLSADPEALRTADDWSGFMTVLGEELGGEKTDRAVLAEQVTTILRDRLQLQGYPLEAENPEDNVPQIGQQLSAGLQFPGSPPFPPQAPSPYEDLFNRRRR